MPSPTYAIKKQEFLNSVVNKIGRQIYSTTAYSDPLQKKVLLKMQMKSKKFTLQEPWVMTMTLMEKVH